MGSSNSISLPTQRTADDSLSRVLAAARTTSQDDAREVGFRYPRRAIRGLQLRDESQGSHASARSSRRGCTAVHRCIADALLPSQDECALREILEGVDPSTELIVSEP